MSEPYTVGTTIRVTGTFRNIAGDLADPSTITFKYRKPGGGAATTVTYAGGGVTKSSTGVYYVDLSTTDDEHGIWSYRWSSTGTPATATESTFAVADSTFD